MRSPRARRHRTPLEHNHLAGDASVAKEPGAGRKRLGEYLLEAGLLTEEQLKESLRQQRQTKDPLGQVLSRAGLVSETDVCRVLHEQLGLPLVDFAATAIDESVIALIKEELAKKYTAIPIALEDRSTLRVAMADPLNQRAIDDIRFQSGFFVKPALAPPSAIVEAISKYYHIDASVVEILENIIKDDPISEVREIVETQSDASIEELMKLSAGPPIVRLANWVITRAVEMRASDIHIEPQERGVGVRVRVDGLLQDLERLPKWTQGAMISRVKILASLDIAEKRMPQDGHFRVELEGRRIDMRVSTLPTAHGEKIVIRIVDQDRAAFRLDSLGFSPANLERMKTFGKRPQGIVMVTGPTGSGKTTLLYALLQHIHSVTKNIVTVEDPIEYQVAGVNQVQVDERSKKTFGAILRAMLRQDPDVMMIGEIRDAETAQIAFRASITGHLVLSTVHTNDAPSAVTRLVDLGLQPYMVASSLVAVVSMRLIRLLCPKCKDGYVPTGDDLRLLGLSKGEARDLVLYRPQGCPACGETGYRDRTGVFEVLEMTDTIRRLVAGHATETLIRRAAMEEGMISIGQDGLAKVLAGETALEEIQRVVYYEEELGHLCAACHQSVASDHVYCPNCGTPSSGACTSCGRRVDPEWGFCPSCGARRQHVMGPPPPEEPRVGDAAPSHVKDDVASSHAPRPVHAPRRP